MPQIRLENGETAQVSRKMGRFSVISRGNGAKAPVLRAEAGEKRAIKAVITTNAPDRAGDIIEPAGISLANYLKNPVVLLQHRSDSPIARCTNITVFGDRLEAIAEFPDEGQDALADLVYRRIKAGIINAVSIGLNPLEQGWEFIDDTDPWGGIRYTKTDMLEFSFVALPMNPEALILERSLGDDDLQRFEAIGRELAPTLMRAEESAPDPEPDSTGDDEDDAEDACNRADDTAKKETAARLRRVAVERLRLTA